MKNKTQAVKTALLSAFGRQNLWKIKSSKMQRTKRIQSTLISRSNICSIEIFLRKIELISDT